MVSGADKEIAAQVPLTPGGTRARPKHEPVGEQAAAAPGAHNAVGNENDGMTSPKTPRSAKRKGFSLADSEVLAHAPS